jgi:hypothetical protein
MRFILLFGDNVFPTPLLDLDILQRSFSLGGFQSFRREIQCPLQNAFMNTFILFGICTPESDFTLLQNAKIQNKNITPLEAAKQQFELASEILGLDSRVHETLKQPKRSMIVSVPIKRENGLINVFTGFRSFASLSVK